MSDHKDDELESGYARELEGDEVNHLDDLPTYDFSGLKCESCGTLTDNAGSFQMNETLDRVMSCASCEPEKFI